MPTVIPPVDPLGLPAAASLLKALSLLTFTLHLLAINVTVGGLLMLLVYGRRPQGDSGALFASRMRALLPASMAITITLGVAPLLFLQVLYGQAFYTSSVLMAWSWLLIIPALCVAYLGLYLAYLRPSWLGDRGQALAWLSAVLTLLVAAVFANNMTLMLEPGLWAPIYAASAYGTALNLGDPMLPARYLHTVLAAPAVAGLACCLMGLRFRSLDADWAAWAHRTGMHWFHVGAGLLMVSGVWYLLALPPRIGRQFMGASAHDTGVLALGIVLGLAALAVAKRATWLATVLTGLGVGCMVMARHRVREYMLAPHVNAAGIPVHADNGWAAAFAVTLVLGVAAVVWLVRCALRCRGSREGATSG